MEDKKPLFQDPDNGGGAPGATADTTDLGNDTGSGEAQPVLSIQERAMIVSAMMAMDKRYLPNVLPVGPVFGYMASLPTERRTAAIFLLKEVVRSIKGPVGGAWRQPLERALSLVFLTDEDPAESSPGLSPEQLQKRVAEGRKPKNADGADDGDGGAGDDAGLDSFVDGAGTDPDAEKPEDKPKPKASTKAKAGAKGKAKS